MTSGLEAVRRYALGLPEFIYGGVVLVGLFQRQTAGGVGKGAAHRVHAELEKRWEDAAPREPLPAPAFLVQDTAAVQALTALEIVADGLVCVARRRGLRS